MKKPKNAKLIEGSVGKILFNLTIPMIFGMLGMIIFNLVDTYFVGKLGTDELAALSFTFPVVLVIHSLALGLGIGASAIISRAIGEGNDEHVRRFTTDSLILGLGTVLIFVIIGLATIEPLFTLLGASSDMLPLISDYMRIWYVGMIFVIVPMVGNNAIRATGDMRTPALIMIIAAGVNTILDYLLIFGIGPFPRLEIAGAALATVIGRAITFTLATYILIHREKMVSFARTSFKQIWTTWRKVLYIGLPMAGTRIIIPIGMGIITRMLAMYGKEFVAAFGVSTRIEFFAMSVLAALSTVLGPFIGQNLGAGKFDRIKKGVEISNQFAVLYGLIMVVLFMLSSRFLAGLFNDNVVVQQTIVMYLGIVSIGYGFHGMLLLSVSALNVLHKPIHAALLSLFQMFVLFVPMAIAGSHFFGVKGIFGALALAYIFSGLGGRWVLSGMIKKLSHSEFIK